MRDRRLTEFARANRKAPSEPETRLWLALKAKRCENIKFRHQKVIGGYIVDFAARRPMLAIEIDRETHADTEGYYARRTRYLEEQGYKVIRFSNKDVMENLEGVLQVVLDVVVLPLSQPSPLKGKGL